MALSLKGSMTGDKIDKNRAVKVKTGGRKLGTPNKRTVSFIKDLDSSDVDVWAKMKDILDNGDNREKVEIIKAILKYRYPVPVAVTNDESIDVTPEPEIDLRTIK